MTRLSRLSVAALLVLLLAAANARAEFISGTVTDVLPDRMQFVMADTDGKTHDFKMDEDAQVYINDVPGVLEDLQAGDLVEIVFRYEEADMLAIEIRCIR